MKWGKMNIKIELKNIFLSYDHTVIFEDFSMQLDDNKFYTLLGPSGCGKTTILNLIAGFIKPDAGQILIDGIDVTNIEPNKRLVNTVFQDYALFPHLNVYDNVAFSLSLQKISKIEKKKRVMDALNFVNLGEYIYRDIAELSGGQKQRVAIARAIINQPKVLLLDEPLSALDLKLRTEMQYELKKLQKELAITFVFVTHDQEEALGMSDYIYVLNNGQVMQKGNPIDIYDEPKNRFVADFIGESNIISAKYLGDYQVKINNDIYKCVDGNFNQGTLVDVVIRPEDLKIVTHKTKLKVQIITRLFKGMHYEIVGQDISGEKWLIHSIKNVMPGEEVFLDFDPEDIHLMSTNV